MWKNGEKSKFVDIGWLIKNFSATKDIWEIKEELSSMTQPLKSNQVLWEDKPQKN